MPDIKQLVQLTIQDPKAAAAQILGLQIDRQVTYLGFALVLVLSTMLDVIYKMLLPMPEPISGLLSGTFTTLLLVATAQLAVTAAITWIGRAIGGQGRFHDILTLSVWLSFISLIFQTIGLLLFIALPGMAGMFVLATQLYIFYLYLHFVNNAHEFDSMWKSFGVAMLSSLVLVFMLMLFL